MQELTTIVCSPIADLRFKPLQAKPSIIWTDKVNDDPQVQEILEERLEVLSGQVKPGFG